MTTAVVKADHRRVKSAAFLFVCGCAGAAPHWLDNVRALWPAFTLAFLLGGYGLRTVMRAALGQTGDTSMAQSSPGLTSAIPAWMWWWRPVMRRRRDPIGGAAASPRYPKRLPVHLGDRRRKP